MPDQDHFWSKAARTYEKEFIDPYLPGVRSPLQSALQKIAGNGAKVVGDLGCGIGPLVPFLADHFKTVHALDFAEGMLERARVAAGDRSNVHFHQRSFLDLTPLHDTLDVAVSVNSLVLPNVADMEAALKQIHRCLKPGGYFLGILPAMDGIAYHTMLLLDRALDMGKPIEAARKSAAQFNDHDSYDFAFGQFRYQGLEQHFWQRDEIGYRLRRAGFGGVRLKKVHLAWKQFSCWRDLEKYPPPWDWFFLARRK